MTSRMRKAIYRGSDEEARALFARAAEVHVATTGEDGQPILRTVNAVLDEDGGAIAFHGAPAGEKVEAVKQGYDWSVKVNDYEHYTIPNAVIWGG